MIRVESARHSGTSFVPGVDNVHLWIEEGDSVRLSETWNEYLVELGLAEPLVLLRDSPPRLHAHAWCYPFLPLRVIEQVVKQARSRKPNRDLSKTLSDHAYDLDSYNKTTLLYRQEALARGWSVWPLLLGQMPSLIFGIGKHHRLAPMNLNPEASAVIGAAGFHKAVGRDLLSAYGFPVAPGGLARSSAMAVSMAQSIGWPVVLKRLFGGNGDGVITGVTNADACREAARELLKGNGAIVVEKQIDGSEMRVHFVGGKIAEVRRREPARIEGDGRSTIRQLLEHARPGFLALAARSPWAGQLMVYRLWSLGVRRLGDIARIIPPPGVSATVGQRLDTGKGGRFSIRNIHPADRRLIESFLAHFGRPSGALDVILSRAGAPLADGGAVLEINVPSGFWYLSNARAAVRRELDLWVSGDPTFETGKGRVPFWLVGTENSEAFQRLVQRRFRERYPDGVAVRLRERGGWTPVITARADAILVRLTDDDVRKHGLPVNAAPIVWFEHGRGSFERAHPLLSAAVRNCGEGVRYRRS